LCIRLAVSNGTITLHERDTTDQLIGKIEEVIVVVTELVEGSLDWVGACQRLPVYDGVQAITRSRMAHNIMHKGIVFSHQYTAITFQG